MDVIKLINYKNDLKLILILSIICFISSISIQLILEEIPCLLCSITRYGFLFTSIVCFITLKYMNNNKFIIFLPSIFLLLLLILTFYHLGVENHWWSAPRGCKTILPTIDDIKSGKIIQNNNIPCDRVNFKVLGVSMTLISFVISSFLFWLSSISTVLHLYRNK